MTADLFAAVHEFAAHPRILVATDFDGALAPLVLDPRDSRPVEGSMESLTALAALPGVTVALVSGRELAALRQLTGAQDPVLLLGSHGSEDSRRQGGLNLSEEQQDTLAALDAELPTLVSEHAGARIETKPSSRVVHTRGLPEEMSTAALAAATALGDRHAVHLTPGKQVLELAVAHVGKGPALAALAAELGVDAIFFSGDDVTDEQGFVALAEDADSERADRRLTIRVGDGETAALHRVPDEAALMEVFGALLAARQRSHSVR